MELVWEEERGRYCLYMIKENGIKMKIFDPNYPEESYIMYPTKEQIKELCLHLCFNCENDSTCDGHCYECESEHWKKYAWQVKETIKMWEKMRGK